MSVHTEEVSLGDPLFAPPAAQSALRAYVAQARGAPLAISLTLFGVFLPVLIVPYAFSDDYSILWMAVSGQASPQFGKNILDANAIGGRPIAGLLGQGLFEAAGSIANLRFVRLFTVVCLVALALLLHWALVRSRVKSTVAALIAVLILHVARGPDLQRVGGALRRAPRRTARRHRVAAGGFCGGRATAAAGRSPRRRRSPSSSRRC